MMQREAGFTLIELLTVIVTVSILASLSAASFFSARDKASYSLVSSTIRDSRTAIEFALADADNPPGPVPLAVQDTAGPVTGVAGTILPGIVLPRNTRLSVAYDPGCELGACASATLTVGACLADLSGTLVRFGDGSYSWLDKIAGAGC